jgi:hypothetical protein
MVVKTKKASDNTCNEQIPSLSTMEPSIAAIDVELKEITSHLVQQEVNAMDSTH